MLDEIDATLDESNVQSFGQYLRKFSERTNCPDYHRRGTMENSDVLYGVAMEEKGVSRMVSVRLEDEIQLNVSINYILYRKEENKNMENKKDRKRFAFQG